MRRCLGLWLVIGLAPARAAGPAMTGSACEGCHRAETEAYRTTHMNSATVRALDSGFAQHVGTATLQEPGGGYRFLYRKTASDLKVLAVRGSDHAIGSIEWVLGSGAQGQTPIVEADGHFFESRVSFFPNLGQYGITVGQSAEASAHAAAALGRTKTNGQMMECFGCHSVVRDASFQQIEPGVQCEQCHPGAARHAVDGKTRPINPGSLSAEGQIRLCGNCHRTGSPGTGTELENVRFQPLRLMKSRCFIAGKIACTTCHDAHQDARREAAAFYNSKCTTCHTGPKPHSDARSHGDCIGCHMPQIQIHPALRFTDHFIRAVKPSDYPADAVTERPGG